MKKIIGIMTTVFMFVCFCLGIVACNNTVEKSETGAQGTDKLMYYLLSDGTYAVGQDNTQDLTQDLEKIVIPSTYKGKAVTMIADEGFENSTAKNITIPDSVTTIGYQAFRHCSSLTSVTIGKGVTSIGFAAFEYCSNLSIIKYRGKVAQWQTISKDDCDGSRTGDYTVEYNYKGK